MGDKVLLWELSSVAQLQGSCSVNLRRRSYQRKHGRRKQWDVRQIKSLCHKPVLMQHMSPLRSCHRQAPTFVFLNFSYASLSAALSSLAPPSNAVTEVPSQNTATLATLCLLHFLGADITSALPGHFFFVSGVLTNPNELSKRGEIRPGRDNREHGVPGLKP